MILSEGVLCVCCSSAPACRRQASQEASLRAPASLVARLLARSLLGPSSPLAASPPSSDVRTMAQLLLQLARAHRQCCSRQKGRLAQRGDQHLRRVLIERAWVL